MSEARLRSVYTPGIGPVVTAATDAGPHDAETYSKAFVDFIAQLPSYVKPGTPKYLEAVAFRRSVVQILTPLIQATIDDERRRLTGLSNSQDPDDDETIEQAVVGIVAAARLTRWGPHYAMAHVRQALKDELHHKFPVIRGVEQRWHADCQAA